MFLHPPLTFLGIAQDTHRNISDMGASGTLFLIARNDDELLAEAECAWNISGAH
jgi:hypothetical protein